MTLLSQRLRPISRLSIIKRSLTTLLTGEERQEALNKLGTSPFPWQELPDRDAIHKTYMFGDFNQAWRFMSGVALEAEKADHHPEWFNVYSTVEVTLTTHDCGGVSQKDIDLATKMDAMAAEVLPTNASSS